MKPPTLPLPGLSLRTRLVAAMVLVALVPALLLTYHMASRAAEQRTERAADRIARSAVNAAGTVEQFIDKHRDAVTSIADAIAADADYGAAALQRWLEVFHPNYGSFLTMLVTDAQGIVQGATLGPDGRPTVFALDDVSIADRDYFREPMRSNAPYLSGAFRGRGLGNDVIVAISAPIRGAQPLGNDLPPPAGIVEGSLDLRVFRDLFGAQRLDPGVDAVLLDADGRIVFASPGLGLELLEPLDATRWSGAADAPDHAAGYLTASARTSAQWRVLLRRSLRDVTGDLGEEFAAVGGWFAIALLGALALALLLAAGISRPLAWLDATVEALDPEHDVPSPPAQAPPEIRRIADHLRAVNTRLGRSYTALRHSLQAGEQLRAELAEVVRARDTEIAHRTAELERANATLEKLVRKDALTGLANRRRLTEFLGTAWQAGLREQTPVSIALVDIDYFKAFNDTYGHVEGDDCLVRVAGAIGAAAARPLDLAARFGGEEFAVVLNNTPQEGALGVAERIRSAVLDLAIPNRGSPFGCVTVSVGVVTAVPARGDESTDFLVEADQALYAAKRGGRNRVVAAAEVVTLTGVARNGG